MNVTVTLQSKEKQQQPLRYHLTETKTETSSARLYGHNPSMPTNDT